MADEAAGQAAIDRWDGKEFDGRMLSVSMARPQGERTERAPRAGGSYGDRPRGGDRGGYGNAY